MMQCKMALMGEQEFIFDAKEMRRVAVVCGKCGTEVVFDAGSEHPHPPSACPGCGEDFNGLDKGVYAWLGLYRQWYRAVAESKLHRFRFRVIPPEK